MSTDTALWGQRDQVLQSLYISPALQTLVPNDLIGSEDDLPDGLEDFVVKTDLSALQDSLQYYCRGAATRFFNLPSARKALERTLKANWPEILAWLNGSTDVRFAFDYSLPATTPFAGYGIHHSAPAEVLWSRNLRVVLQRTKENAYVVWTAYPLLVPNGCAAPALVEGTARARKPSYKDVFTYFLDCYLPVTSDCMLVDSLVMGSTDFWKYENAATLKLLLKSLERFDPKQLSDADSAYVREKLTTRCLDQSLPVRYIERPDIFVKSLRSAVKTVCDAPPAEVE